MRRGGAKCMDKLFIILLSGPFKVGKSTLTTELEKSFSFRKVSSSGYLRALIPNIDQLNEAESRLQLQEKGDQLDIDSDYMWVIDPVTTSVIAQNPNNLNWLVDAVRKKRQVEHFRERFGSSLTHVHLTAPEAILRSRSSLTDEVYERAINHPNEVNARALGKFADQVFDTSKHTPQQIAARLAKEARHA